MKKLLITALASLAGILAMPLGARAADRDLNLVLVPNNHGQYTPLYRSAETTTEPTIGLNIGNQGLGNNIVVARPSREYVVTKKVTGHGSHNTVQYWRRK